MFEKLHDKVEDNQITEIKNYKYFHQHLKYVKNFFNC